MSSPQTPRPEAVAVPVTLLYGDSDLPRPDERARTRALLQKGCMATLANSGHFAAAENPMGLARIILGELVLDS